MSDAIERFASDAQDALAELSDSAQGFWAVSTVSGSTYLIDLDHRVVLRQSVSDGAVDHALRRDTEPLRLMSISRCAIGERMLLIIDLQVAGVDFTSRMTTPVTRIQRIRGLISGSDVPETTAIQDPIAVSVAGPEGQECGK